MVFEGLINQRLVILQQNLGQSNGQDSMRQLLSIFDSLLREHPREVLLHERVKIVQEIIEKPVVQRIENTIIKEVYLRDPIIVREPKLRGNYLSLLHYRLNFYIFVN